MDDFEWIMYILNLIYKIYHIVFPDLSRIWFYYWSHGYEIMTVAYLMFYFPIEQFEYIHMVLGPSLLNDLVSYLYPQQLIQIADLLEAGLLDKQTIILILKHFNDIQLSEMAILLDMNELQLTKLSTLLHKHEEFQQLVQHIDMKSLAKLLDNIDPSTLKTLLTKFSVEDLLKLLSVIDSSYLMKLHTDLQAKEIMLLFQRLELQEFTRVLKFFHIVDIKLIVINLNDTKFRALLAQSDIGKTLDLYKFLGATTFNKLLEDYTVKEILRMTRNLDRKQFYRLKKLYQSFK